MNEEYLQLIWDRARLPIPSLKLTDGRSLIIKNTGDHNLKFSGPDFYNACLEYDSLEFHGSVEIHVNGSDWYRHNHHLDQSFESVVLHVVYNDDKQVEQNGFMIPTLELKEFIDPEHFRLIAKGLPNKSSYPCATFFDQVDSVFWTSMKSKALIDKWSCKVKELVYLNEEEVLFRLIASSFGMGVNKKAFETLATVLPWSQLAALSGEQRLQLILVSSGWVSDDYSYMYGSDSRWHFRGTRPANFPKNRILQFATFISRFEIKDLAGLVREENFVQQFKVLCQENLFIDSDVRFSSALLDSILINGFVPFLWWKGENAYDHSFQEMASVVLEQVSAEKNGVIDQWRKIGIEVKSALDSQGLLALNRYFCRSKKCLSCEVGLRVLDREL